MNRDSTINARLSDLERHLERENPVLLEVVRRFRELDRVGRRLGVLARDDSFALGIPWWPLIAVLGTFSAGKSTFINQLVGASLQKTGNQAVDDKFTVICYSSDEDGRVLPGLALDADVRFPFFRISDEIERVASGEGRRVDAYLQLKTSSSETLKGKILIDSPGFDADSQRTSTLRITKHIIDLSDLVLVLFDARHPEPGAMQDTLNHLVAETIERADSNKFLYILNQIDTAAREDNPEDVVAAWQRALSQKGLTAGRFYAIYNEAVAVPIEDEATRRRFQAKRDTDLADIQERIRQVEVERAYRIVGALEHTADRIEHEWVPGLASLNRTWARRVFWSDAVLAVLVIALGVGVTAAFDGFTAVAEFAVGLVAERVLGLTALAIAGAVLLAVHFGVRRVVTRRMLAQLERAEDLGYWRAFRRNTRFWRSIYRVQPAGWGRRSRNLLTGVRQAASGYVQALNDRYTNPSGEPRAADLPGDAEPGTPAAQEIHEQLAALDAAALAGASTKPAGR